MAGNYAEICKVISRLMTFGLVVITLWLGTTAGHCADFNKTMTIKPSQSVDLWTVTLDANQSAEVLVVIETPTGWQLVGQPTVQINGPSTTLWTRIGTTPEYRFAVTNTGNATQSTTVEVRCVWRRTAVAGSGGPGGGVPGSAGPGSGGTSDIHGLATAIAYFFHGAHVVWQFWPSTIVSVGDKIHWRVAYFNSNGQQSAVVYNQMCPVNVTPDTSYSHWTHGPVTGIGPCMNGTAPAAVTAWTGWFRCSQPSSGQLQVTLTHQGTQHQEISNTTLSVLKVDITPNSGPIGTKLTIRMSPPGLGLFSASSTASATGKFRPIPTSLGETTEVTLDYAGSKVHYDPSLPDQIQVVVGDVLPPASFFISNPQVALASGGSCQMDVTVNASGVTCLTPFTFTLIPEVALGTVSSGSFTPVTTFSPGQELRAQVLIKDDGLGTAPSTVVVKVQSYDATGALITTSLTDTADPSCAVTLTKLTSGGTPGFHTYWSDGAAPIVPWPYEVMPTTEFAGRIFIYYVTGGKLEVEYAP